MTANLDKSRAQGAARPVFDPAVPDATVDAIADLAAGYPQLLADGDNGNDLIVGTSEGGRILRNSVAVAGCGGGAALATWLAGRFLGESPSAADTDLGHRTESISALFRDLLEYLQNVGLIVMAGGAIVAALAVGIRVSQNRWMEKALAQARGRYVHPGWLTDEAAQLLARAQQAADTVLGSRLTKDDMEGLGTANRVQMPDRIWFLAQSLHRYSRAMTASARTDGPGAALRELLAGERAALVTVRCAIEDQVAALEAYARQAQEVDRIAADRRAVERLEARSEALLDLVAETVASEVAVDEINPLTEKAAAVALSLTEALAAAKDAATAALPPGR